MESLKAEIQGLKRKLLYFTLVYVMTVILYNFSLIQCLQNYSQIQSYYRESFQEIQELRETLELIRDQLQEKNEVL